MFSCTLYVYNTYHHYVSVYCIYIYIIIYIYNYIYIQHVCIYIIIYNYNQLSSNVYIYTYNYIIIYIIDVDYDIVHMTPKLITWSISYLDLYYIEREMLLQDQAVTQSSITHYHSVLCMALGTVLQVKPRLISDQDRRSAKLPEASWTHSINRSMPEYASVR